MYFYLNYLKKGNLVNFIGILIRKLDMVPTQAYYIGLHNSFWNLYTVPSYFYQLLSKKIVFVKLFLFVVSDHIQDLYNYMYSYTSMYYLIDIRSRPVSPLEIETRKIVNDAI